jgi:hypothetical protein
MALVGVATTTSGAPAPAIIDEKPPGNHENHDLRLEY